LIRFEALNQEIDSQKKEQKFETKDENKKEESQSKVERIHLSSKNVHRWRQSRKSRGLK
jgi:hypothetical protein